MKVFIGFDQMEEDAYRVCAKSLMSHASIPLEITKLDADRLRYDGIYSRKYQTRNGQKFDLQDGRPFSTDFAFTRFLVPFLCHYQGWAVFCDCDFLYIADIASLAPLLDESKAVMVVKHQHVPSEQVKMDGQIQSAYPRKNWSSFIAWNCGHPANKVLTPEVVNKYSGRSLHGFSWLRDSEIGELPQTWNWLAGINDPLDETPKAIHFTLGVPSMKGHENSPYADLWREELTRLAEKEVT